MFTKINKIGLAIIAAIGLTATPLSALAVDFHISNVSVPPHAGIPTLTFDVTGAVAAKFSNCYDMMSTLGPVVKLNDDQGAKTLLVAASWGLTAKTVQIMADGLRCEIRTAEADSYNFGPNQDSTPQTYELIFGTVSSSGTTTMLNSSLAPVAPQIISPTRGQTIPGFATVKFDGDLPSKFKVYKRWIWACVDACPTGSPGFLASSGTFDEPKTAYIVFDDKAAEGKTVEIHATWFYTNASGSNGYVSRSVTLNVKGAGVANPIPQSFAAKVTKIKLRAQFGCPWPTIGTKKLNCSIRPKFTIMTDLNDQQVLKDFAVAYRSKFKIQTSTNGKSWKTVQTLPYNSGAETKFVVPFNPKQPKNYLRVVSSGIPFIDSSTEFSKYVFGRTVY